jgi:hypothetical protein
MKEVYEPRSGMSIKYGSSQNVGCGIKDRGKDVSGHQSYRESGAAFWITISVDKVA